MATYIWKKKKYATRSDWMKARWSDNTEKEKISEKISKAMTGKRRAYKPRPRMKAAWKRLEYRKQQSLSRKKAWSKKEVADRHGVGMRRYYATQSAADKLKHMLPALTAAHKVTRSPAYRKLQSAKLREQNNRLWADPKYRKKMLVIRKEQARRPEEIKRRRIATRLAWKNGQYRRKQLQTRSTSLAFTVTRLKKISKSLKGRRSWNTGHTKETHPSLAKMSKTSMGKVPNWKKYGKYYIGKRGKVWMRSTWEIALAEWYDFHGVKWQYEPKYFVVGKGTWRGETYTPDFYLPKEKQYVEVKGYLNKSNARKMEAFKTKYPEIKLVMFRKAELQAMGVL